MKLLKTLHENAKKDASEEHVEDERDYFEYGIKCLDGLIEFVNKEKKEAEDKDRIRDYDKIADESKTLRDSMQKHLDRYK